MRQSRTTMRRTRTDRPPPLRRAIPIDGGTLRIQHCDLLPLSPLPNGWVMLKSGDFLVSRSGTIRLLLKKAWEHGNAECLRLRCEGEAGQLVASLDIEKMELNSSNFENLMLVVRESTASSPENAEIAASHLGKTVRYNILTLLGFGKIGSSLHVVLPALAAETNEAQIRVGMQVDGAAGQFLELCLLEDSPAAKRAPTAGKPFLEIELLWMRDEEHRIFRIEGFTYPAGTPTVVLECVTLSCELANRMSVTSSIGGA